MNATRQFYPLGAPVILDTLAYERTNREQSTDPEPHQYVGTVSGYGMLFAGDSPRQLYIVTLCSPDRFEDPKRANGMHVANMLVDESCILADTRGAA